MTAVFVILVGVMCYWLGKNQRVLDSKLDKILKHLGITEEEK